MMASLMRLVAKYPLIKGFKNNFLIENLIMQHRQIANQIRFQVNDFIEKKKTQSGVFEKHDLLNLKRLLNNSLNKIKDQEEYKGFFELYKNQFINLIYSTEDEQNIPLLLEFIKINKEQIIKQRRHFYSISIFKLFYYLKLTDKSLEIFKNEDIGEVFRNLGATKFLMAQLAEEKRFQDVVDVFFSYLDHIKHEKSTKPNSSTAEMIETNKFIENDQIDILSRTLLLMNSTDSMFNFELIFSYLRQSNFFLSPSSTINAILLAVKQENYKFAQLVLSDYEKTYKQTLILNNLKAIIFASNNENEKAIEEIKHLCDKNNFSIKNLEGRLFPTTLSTLKKSMDKETNLQTKNEYLSLIKFLKNKKNIIRRFDIDSYSEFLIEQRIKKHTEKMKVFYLKRQQINNESRKKWLEKRKKLKIDKQKYTQGRSKLNSQELKKQAINSLIKISKNGGDVKKIADNDESSVTFKSRKNTNEKQTSGIVDTFIKYHKSEIYFDRLTQRCLQQITSSLLLQNSKKSLETMKLLIEECAIKKKKLNNTSKLHFYLLTCFQNEPQYGLNYLSENNIENLGETFYKNLKIIGYIHMENYDEIQTEIENIQNMNLNMFNNSGYILPFVIDYLRCMSLNLNKKIQSKKNDFLTFITNVNRISTIDLFDYCDFKNDKDYEFFSEKLWSSFDYYQKYENIDKFDNRNMMINYETKNSDLVIKTYIEALLKDSILMNLKMTKYQADILATSIIKNASTFSKDIMDLIKLLNTKYKLFFSSQNQFDIYIKLIENDPVYGLEFLSTLVENGNIPRIYPSIYKNMVSIGMFLNDHVEIALEQIETILDISNEKCDSYEGKVFLLNLNIMENIIEYSNLKKNRSHTEQKLAKKIEKLIKRINSENRLLIIDLEHLELRED